MERVIIIFCGYFAALIGALAMAYGIFGDQGGTELWFYGFLVTVLAGMLTWFARKLPQT